MRFIPKDTKVRMRFYKNFTLSDIIFGVCLLAVIALIAASNLPYKLIFALGFACLSIPLFLPVGDERIYMTAFHMLKHLFSKKIYVKGGKSDTADLFPYDRLENNYIVNKDGTYTGVLEIRPFEFRLLSALKQDFIIDGAMTAVYNVRKGGLGNWSPMAKE